MAKLPPRRFRVPLITMFCAALLVGCPDEDTPENNANNTADAAMDTSSTDVEADGTDATTDADTGTSDAEGGDADDTGDAVDTYDAWAECEPGTDATQTCAYPSEDASCTQGDWGASSWVETFVVEDNGECCFDLDGDGNLDSGLSRLKSIISGLAGEEFNTIIANEIESGELNYLFTYSDWENPVTDDQAQIDIVFGDSTNTWEEKQAGGAQFAIQPDSLDTNGDPNSEIDSGEVCSSRIRAIGGNAPMRVPAGTGLIRVTLRDVHIEADVAEGADLSSGGQVALTNGKLGGFVPVASIFGGLNEIAQSCECLGKDVFEQTNGQWACTATEEDRTACGEDGVLAFCQEFLSVPSACGFAAQTIVGDADYDGLPLDDPDGEIDSFSFGATFTAKGAEITGVAQ